jgi:hypothetical protein
MRTFVQVQIVCQSCQMAKRTPSHRTCCTAAACGVGGHQISGQWHLHLLHGLARHKGLGLIPECWLRQRLRT